MRELISIISENGATIMLIQALVSTIVLVVGIVISIYNARVAKRLMIYSHYADLELTGLSTKTTYEMTTYSIYLENRSGFVAYDIQIDWPNKKAIKKLSDNASVKYIYDYEFVQRASVSPHSNIKEDFTSANFDLPVRVKWRTASGVLTSRYYIKSGGSYKPWFKYNKVIRWGYFHVMRLSTLKSRIIGKMVYFQKKQFVRLIVCILAKIGPTTYDHISDQIPQRSDQDVKKMLSYMEKKGLILESNGDKKLNMESKKVKRILERTD